MKKAHDSMQWVQRAEEDYQLCRSSLRRKTPLTYGATFHAQQCGEKYLKALLSIHQVSFPHTHDLSALGSLCQLNGIILPISEDDLEKLSAYAVEARYPGIQLTVEEAKDAFRISQSIRKYARKLIIIP